MPRDAAPVVGKPITMFPAIMNGVTEGASIYWDEDNVYIWWNQRVGTVVDPGSSSRDVDIDVHFNVQAWK